MSDKPVKLCPREPTPEMCDAACRRADTEGVEMWLDQARDYWQFMYDAAPNAAPAAAPDDGLIDELRSVESRLYRMWPDDIRGLTWKAAAALTAAHAREQAQQAEIRTLRNAAVTVTEENERLRTALREALDHASSLRDFVAEGGSIGMVGARNAVGEADEAMDRLFPLTRAAAIRARTQGGDDAVDR